MEILPAAAALVTVAGAVMSAVARTRVVLVAGLAAALLLLPLARPGLPAAVPWTLAAAWFGVAVLLGLYLVWISTRGTGSRFGPDRSLPAWAWLIASGATLTAGIAAWPTIVGWVDPGRVVGAILTGPLEPGRWVFGAGLALLAVGIGRMLPSGAPPRLAAAPGLIAGGAWLVATGLGGVLADVALPFVGLVLPAGAAVVATHARMAVTRA